MELHRFAVTFTQQGETRSWEGLVDVHGYRFEFTSLSQLNQKGVINNLRIRDLGIVRDDLHSLMDLVRSLRDSVPVDRAR